jgi:hypothetical protein
VPGRANLGFVNIASESRNVKPVGANCIFAFFSASIPYFPKRGDLLGLPLRVTFSPAHPMAGILTHPTLRLLRNRFPETCH